MKVLSIIIPAFNMERYLSRTLQSLLVGGPEQDSLEIIVVNDGSKDSTSNIAHQFAVQYPNVVRVIDKQNGHYGSCINAALKELGGVYVKIIDADDSVETANFRRFLSFLIQNNGDPAFASVDCYLSDSLRVTETDEILSNETVPIPSNRILAKSEIPRHFIFQMYAITYRASILLDNNYRQTEGILYTDTEWMAYPLAWVRELYYWSGNPVYKYLIGRAGQSVAPEVYRRCVAHRIMMFARMIRESNNVAISEADRFRLSFVSETGIMALYRRAFECSDAKRINETMKEVDDNIKSTGDDVYQRIAEVPLSPYIKFRVVRMWRKRYYFSRGMIMFIRSMIAIEAVSGPFRSLIRKVSNYI